MFRKFSSFVCATIFRIAGPVVLVTLIATSMAPRAQASLLFTLQRISDTEAIMTAAGSPGLGLTEGFYRSLEMRFLAGGTFTFAAVEETGDFVFGSNRDSSGWAVEKGDMLSVATPLNDFTYVDTDVPSGTAHLKAVGGAYFSPVGTGADVYAKYTSLTGTNTVLVGTWIMVEPISGVPEPSSVLLVFPALAGLGFLHRRRDSRITIPRGSHHGKD